ncbi:hypothetical protein ACGFNV_38390 [Streptomyces sp. NPDC048751]|uniref:hypothetical protein n=1 Tax=Streptomyces sp. NPDC048751 TaxID=3365591 RepID=UPI0037242692
MRSARLLLTTAAASAVLALAATGAHAADGWDHDDTSSSSSQGKEHDKDKDAEHGKPHGGMHTGGGALTAVTGGDDWATAHDPKYDPETYKEKDSSDGHSKDSSAKEKDDWSGASKEKDDWSGESKEKDDWSGESKEKDEDSWGGGDHDKPHGGMHTGGGALAGTTGVTAGGLAVLALGGAGAYTLRRRKTTAGLA